MNAEIVVKIENVFKSYPEIKLAYFFGSQVSGNVGPMSDFDFAFYAHDVAKKKAFDLKLEVMNEIQKILNTDKVDIVCLNLAESPELKYSIIKEGKLIFEEEPYRVIVEPKIMNEYFDFHDLLKRHNLTKA